MGSICYERDENEGQTDLKTEKEKGTRKFSNLDHPPESTTGLRSSLTPLSLSHNATAGEDLKNIKKNNSLKVCYDKLIFELKESPFVRFELLNYLNESKTSNVILIKDKETGQTKVMKEISLSKTVKVEDIKQEIDILKQLDHPNIVKLFEYQHWKEKSYLITEYCEHSELLEVTKKKSKLSEQKISSIIHQLLLALNYCHHQKITHRDIRIKNILIDGIDSQGFYKIKLIDFGMSRFVNEEGINNVEAGFNTKNYYIAPEMISGKYNEKCDIWATGILLYLLLFNEYPFTGNTKTELFNSIISNDLTLAAVDWKKYSPDAINLLKKLLKKDFNQRMSAKDALKHSWFENMKIIEKNSISNQNLNVFLSELKSYKPDYKLQQAALAIIVHNLPKTDKVHELEKAFKMIDKNGDGRISKHELFDQLKTNSKFDAKFAEIFKVADTDKNDYITYEEFIAACIDKHSAVKEEHIQLAFKLFDSDHSGLISFNEIKAVFCGGDPDVGCETLIKEIIHSIDIDKDGLVSYEEFAKMMKQLITLDKRNKTI